MEEARVIPNMKNRLLMPLCGLGRAEITPELYLEKITAFERNCEASLIETFGRLNIQASVKTNPYSLPYNESKMVRLMGESYLNGAYEFHRVVRDVVKEVLNKNVFQIRFYLYINVCDGGILGSGLVEYNFRYHIKSKYPEQAKD